MSLDKSKQNVSDFITKLENEKAHNDLVTSIKSKRSTKLNTIKQETECAKEMTAQDIFSKIYTDALPIDDSYKAAAAAQLDDGVISFIKKRSPDNTCYGYITERAKAGSKFAANFCEAVDKEVSGYFRKFYEEMDDITSDDIKLDDGTRKTIVDKISANMDYDQVSDIIEGHVQQTIQDEIDKTKEEDEHIKELQDSLAADDNVATESAIDEKLHRMGEDQKPFTPSLFNGIMIGQTDAITESAPDLDEEYIGKKAFFESVKEYTKWDMLATLGMEKFSDKDLKYIAIQYARGKM